MINETKTRLDQQVANKIQGTIKYTQRKAEIWRQHIRNILINVNMDNLEVVFLFNLLSTHEHFFRSTVFWHFAKHQFNLTCTWKFPTEYR